MLTDYIKAAMHSAKYKMLDDNCYTTGNDINSY